MMQDYTWGRPIVQPMEEKEEEKKREGKKTTKKEVEKKTAHYVVAIFLILGAAVFAGAPASIEYRTTLSQVATDHIYTIKIVNSGFSYIDMVTVYLAVPAELVTGQNKLIKNTSPGYRIVSDAEALSAGITPPAGYKVICFDVGSVFPRTEKDVKIVIYTPYHTWYFNVNCLILAKNLLGHKATVTFSETVSPG